MAGITLNKEAREEIFEILAGICEDEQVSLGDRIQAAELLVNDGVQNPTPLSKPQERGVAFLGTVVKTGGTEDRLLAARILLRIPETRRGPGARVL